VATIARQQLIGRNGDGSWKPGCMTHAELVRELETATDWRREELRTEARSRMKGSNYPPFPAHLGLEGPE
jgi:hypothetical protein